MRRGLVWMVLVWLVGGCMKPLDFGQVKDFKAEPVWTIDLFYSYLAGSDFYEGSVPVMEVHDTIPFEIFTNRVVRDGLKRMLIYFDVTNPFPASFEFEVEFLDGYHTVRQAESGIIRAASENSPSHEEFVIEINKEEHPDIVLTRRLHLRLSRLDSTDIRRAPGYLTIRSKGDFFMVIQ